MSIGCTQSVVRLNCAAGEKRIKKRKKKLNEKSLVILCRLDRCAVCTAECILQVLGAENEIYFTSFYFPLVVSFFFRKKKHFRF